jgi:hypothetical protein
LNTGSTFNLTISANGSVTFSNVPISGNSVSWMVLAKFSGAFSLTWPAAVIWADGISPTQTSVSGKTDVFTFHTSNGGTTIYGFIGGQNFATTMY